MKTSEFAKLVLDYWLIGDGTSPYICDCAYEVSRSNPLTQSAFSEFSRFIRIEGVGGFHLTRLVPDKEERMQVRYLFLLNIIAYFESIDD